jgi:hypothetical protein
MQILLYVPEVQAGREAKQVLLSPEEVAAIV